MRLYHIILIVLILNSCKRTVDLKYIQSRTWSYEKGFKIGKGDFLLFDKNDKLFDLKQDTIYYEGVPRAVITDLDKEMYIMKIRSIDGEMKGEYRNPEESLR